MATATKKKPTIKQIVDELGDVTEHRKRYEEREEALKAALKKLGAGSYNGVVFDALAIEKYKSYYKADLLREHVDEATLELCKITSPYLEVTTQRKAPKNVKLKVVRT